MRETLDVCRALADSFGQPLWLATVVGVLGSAYRRPGARLLFSAERVLAGALSGGCLEREVLRLGPWLTSRGPVVRTFDHRLDEDGAAGSGCDGKIEVLIEPCAALLQEAEARNAALLVQCSEEGHGTYGVNCFHAAAAPDRPATLSRIAAVERMVEAGELCLHCSGLVQGALAESAAA